MPGFILVCFLSGFRGSGTWYVTTWAQLPLLHLPNMILFRSCWVLHPRQREGGVMLTHYDWLKWPLPYSHQFERKTDKKRYLLTNQQTDNTDTLRQTERRGSNVGSLQLVEMTPTRTVTSERWETKTYLQTDTQTDNKHTWETVEKCFTFHN